MFRYHLIDDFDFNGKVTGLRVDINSPLKDGKVILNERIREHAKTILELSEKGAKVVILAHQGRKGDDDCISLKQHALLIEKQIGKKVKFVEDISSKKVAPEIKKMKNSEILLLENLRFYDDEESFDNKNNSVLVLEELFDIYVNDAFSVAHRSQTSIVGFTKIPLVAGRVMQKEIEGLNNILEVRSPSIYILGGAKPDDLIDIIDYGLSNNRVDYVLLTGVISEIAFLAQGVDIGIKKKFLEDKGYLLSFDKVKLLMEKYHDKIVLPKDYAVFDGKERIDIAIGCDDFSSLSKKYMIQDIGKKTVDYFYHFLKDAQSVYLKGPAGNFEDLNFEYGTREIFSMLSKISAFKYMGGGHSVTALERYGFLNSFSYISLAGGALVRFLSGKKLVGIEALEKSFVKDEKHYEDFLVVGSNTLDIGINVPENFSQLHLGDKIKIEEDFKQSVGGGGVNVAICLSRLGAKVAYLGKLSYENKDKIKEVLDKDKVAMVDSKISKKPCAKSVLIDTKDNDRIILTYRGQNSYLKSSDFDLSVINAKNYYFSSLSDDSFKTLMDIAKDIKDKKPSSLLCFNLSSYIIKTELSLNLLVKKCDIVILNYEEAQEFTNKITISDCLKSLREKCQKLVVITDAANGAYAYDGEKEYYAKAVKPDKIVDTTGAGDGFAGTFFYFYVKGFGIKKSLEFAAKNAASVISYKGSQYGLLYYDDIKKN